MSLAMRCTTLLLPLLGLAGAQDYKFCTTGISTTNFEDNEPIDVIVAQAPLFSTNPKVGGLFGIIGGYHSSIVFAQDKRYWTLEFDNTAPSFIDGVAPMLLKNSTSASGVSLGWRNDARYCLSEGLKWGRKHWIKRFDIVTTISADQARHAFTDFVYPVNSTRHGMQPQYQLWRVVSSDFFGRIKKTLVKDITCADGVQWFLNYLKSDLKAPFAADFSFKATVAIYKARSVEQVNTDDPAELYEMLQYWRSLDDLTLGKKTIPGRLLAFVRMMFRHKYVYDNNAGVYYRLFGWGTWLPMAHYIDFPLEGPPSMRTSTSQGSSLSPLSPVVVV